MAQKKYYAVRHGKKTGIFNTWDECKAQVHGCSGAIYKSFTNKEDAESFIEGEVSSIKDTNSNFVEAYVDGSYSDEYGNYSYGCVIIYGDEIVKLLGVGDNTDYISMRNVAGELLGAMKAIEWACENKCSSIMIYHDYEGITRWTQGKWKTNKEGTKAYAEFIQKQREHIKISFTKVLAHSGVDYNEEADKLAKKALVDSKS